METKVLWISLSMNLQELDKLLGSQYKVLYLSKIQRIEYMVEVNQGGRFVKATDNSLIDMAGTKVMADLGQKATGAPKPVTQAYACDVYGCLFIIPDHQTDSHGNRIQVNHSTLLAGKDVLCAGAISIKRGTLKAISNGSGHYKPDSVALNAMLNELSKAGVDLASVVVQDVHQHIVTTGVRYITGDLKDRSTDASVMNLMDSTT